MKNNNTVSVSFMLLGILFCVCLVAANLLETKVVQIWKITASYVYFLIRGAKIEIISELTGYNCIKYSYQEETASSNNYLFYSQTVWNNER